MWVAKPTGLLAHLVGNPATVTRAGRVRQQHPARRPLGGTPFLYPPGESWNLYGDLDVLPPDSYESSRTQFPTQFPHSATLEKQHT